MCLLPAYCTLSRIDRNGEYTADLNVFQEVFESDASTDLRCGELCGVIPADGYMLSALKDLSVSGLNPDGQQVIS
ncbi:MAG: hypothetical protein ACLU4J_02775 [Butyricimonas paravirosa]